MNKNKHLTDCVDLARWQNAQAWEQEHWLKEQKALAKYGKNFLWRILSALGIVEKYRGDDRNYWWQRWFDNYGFLPPTVDNALEVGCGPYTNMRLIRDVCQPRHLYLSDPQIRTYAKFKMTFVAEMYGKLTCCLDDHPLEELPFADNYFDLVIMINVLDHVKDANLCMKQALRVLKYGGFVVIGQDLTSAEDRDRQPKGLDVGHPITLDHTWFEPYFRETFEEILLKIVSREQGWAPQWHYGTLIYAGKKRF